MPALSALPEKIQFPVVGTFFSFKLIITLAYTAGRKLRDFGRSDEAFRILPAFVFILISLRNVKTFKAPLLA
jgi:hypothetical protein